MSEYGTAHSEMNDIERLYKACVLAGLGDRAKLYPEGNGIYRMFSGKSFCEGGKVRGKNAHLVIHGGLDTSGYYTTVENAGGSGDTAFVLMPDGSIEIKQDIKWHNARANLEIIKNFYQIVPALEKYAAAGIRVDLTVDPVSGKITGRVLTDRPVSARGDVRGTSARPTSVRS